MQARQDLRRAPTPPRLVDAARSACLPASPRLASISPACFSGSPAALLGLHAGAAGTDRPERLPHPLLEAYTPASTHTVHTCSHMHKSAAAHAWAARCTQGHTCSQACTHGHVFTQALVLTHTDPDLCRSDTGRPVLILREPRLPHLKDSDKSVF